MKIVILARSQVEAKLYADQAGLARRDDVFTPGIVQSLDGLRLGEDDLVVEFPGFRHRRDAGTIIEAIHTAIALGKGAGPVWIRAGGKR